MKTAFKAATIAKHRLRQTRRRKRRDRMARIQETNEISRINAHVLKEIKHQEKKEDNGFAKQKYYAALKKWKAGAQERQAAARRAHVAELKEKYAKLIEDFRVKNKLTADSIIEYDPKTKRFKIVKGQMIGKQNANPK